MNSRKRPGHAADAGSAAVEAALIMSALLLAAVGTVETARALWTYNTMLIAVEQAGRYAMMYNHRPRAICANSDPGLAMSRLVEYAASKLFRLVCSAGVGRLPDPFHRRFRCGRHDDIPSHGNDLREPLIRFHRTAPSPLRTTRSDEQRDGPDDLIPAFRRTVGIVWSGNPCGMRDRHLPTSSGLVGDGEMLDSGEAETGIEWRHQ